MLSLFLSFFLTVYAGGFEVRIMEPNLKMPNMEGTAPKKATDKSSFDLDVKGIVNVNLGLELYNVTNDYSVRDVVWKGSVVEVPHVNTTTRAEKVEVSRVGVHVFGIGGSKNRPKGKRAEKPIEKVKIVSELIRPIQIPLPAKIEATVFWNENKPAVKIKNEKAVRDEFAQSAKQIILDALKSETSLEKEGQEMGNDTKRALKEYAASLKELFGDTVKQSFDRSPILLTVLEAILLQISPAIGVVAPGNSMDVVVERVGNYVRVVPVNSNLFVSNELNGILSKATTPNKVFAIFQDYSPKLPSYEKLLRPLLIALGEKVSAESKVVLEEAKFNPWVETKTEKQFIDVELNLAVDGKKLTGVARIEALREGLPKFVGLFRKDNPDALLPTNEALNKSFSQIALQTVVNSQIKKGAEAVSEVEFKGILLHERTVVLVLELKDLAK